MEARALLEGIVRASGRGITKLIIEGDSLTVINALKDTWKPPWEIQSIIEDIKVTLQRFHSVEIYHCFREGNHAADFLARNNCNLSYNLSDPQWRDFHVIIRKDELGWSFVRKTT